MRETTVATHACGAFTGARRLLSEARGRRHHRNGSVSSSNPVQSLGDESLTDQKDADAAVPAAAYHTVPLTNLDGSGYLRGDYATVVSETGNPAYSPTNTFLYTRSQDEFEQVMAYYWITEAQKYIQSLGFGTSTAPVEQRVAGRSDQPVGPGQLVRDRPPEGRAPLRQGRRRRRRGRRGDPARVRPRHPRSARASSSAREEAGAISEGFGDYWAVDCLDIVAQRSACPSASRCPASMDWDATSYTSTVPHCLRRLDTEPALPATTSTARFTDDGQIWSHALWDIRQASATSRRTRSSSGPDRLPGHDDARPREPHGRSREDALRQRRPPPRSARRSRRAGSSSSVRQGGSRLRPRAALPTSRASRAALRGERRGRDAAHRARRARARRARGSPRPRSASSPRRSPSRARSGLPDLKIPEPTNTPSAPSCMQSAASAGVAMPPAVNVTTGRRPFSATHRTSSNGACSSFASLYSSSVAHCAEPRIAPKTDRMCVTALTMSPVPASPFVRIIAAPSRDAP